MNREDIQIYGSLILLFAGIAIMFMGFWVNPTGVIHPSVLTALGEILTFVGSVWGIDYYNKHKYKK